MTESTSQAGSGCRSVFGPLRRAPCAAHASGWHLPLARTIRHVEVVRWCENRADVMRGDKLAICSTMRTPVAATNVSGRRGKTSPDHGRFGTPPRVIPPSVASSTLRESSIRSIPDPRSFGPQIFVPIQEASVKDRPRHVRTPFDEKGRQCSVVAARRAQRVVPHGDSSRKISVSCLRT